MIEKDTFVIVLICGLILLVVLTGLLVQFDRYEQKVKEDLERLKKKEEEFAKRKEGKP